MVNLGRGEGTSVLDIVTAFEKVVGTKVPLEFKAARKGDLPCYWSDCNLAAKVLNWSCIYSIEDICQDSWNWSRWFH